MNAAERDKTLALAGVFQAAKLAQQLARRGDADEIPFHASVRSILITDSINTISIYGGIEGVLVGLRTLREKMTKLGNAADLEVPRYVLQLMQLVRKLKADQSMINTITERIEQTKKRSSSNGEGFTNELYEELAQLYKDTISTLRPKIIVQGEHGHLANPLVVDRVRTVLLAGIRSAFLWDQLGGRRWQLLFNRRAQWANAEEILAELEF